MKSNTYWNLNKILTSMVCSLVVSQTGHHDLQVEVDKGNTPSPAAVVLNCLEATRLQIIYAPIAPQTVVMKVRERWFAIHDTRLRIREEKEQIREVVNPDLRPMFIP